MTELEKSRMGNIIRELRDHTPFTVIGTASGILLMLIFYKIPEKTAYNIFYVLHPAHVVFSALATASMYKLNSGRFKLWFFIAIGYTGSIGIATLSDSIIPYIGEMLLDLPNREAHFGFIEEWWLVNPLAFLGIAIAYFKPNTKIPHMGHVFLSTWASLFHIIMALGGSVNWILVMVMFVFLFIAVLVPCCLSDIIFPLIFVKK